jgi:hypothetical protein
MRCRPLTSRAAPVHGDRPDGGEGGVLGQDILRDRHTQVDRNPVVLGVQGELIAGRGDDLARPELIGTAARLDYHATE